jgi:glucose/arabinose dehydrogenase
MTSRLLACIVILTCVFYGPIVTTNVTFTPTPIRITVADLPKPFTTPSASKDANITRVPLDPQILVPDGFVVKNYWTTDLIKPRLLLETPNGDILVSEYRANRISCLVDHDHDGFPDERLTFADESNKLNFPYGMAFDQNHFYVSNRNGIRRYAWVNGTRKIIGEGELLVDLDPNGHWTRSLLLSPNDGRMFIGIGSLTDHDADPIPKASVQIANLDGTDLSTFAFGLRNPTSLSFHPISNELYVACQERDEIGDDLVPDFFTRLKRDEFYGWPFAYLSSDLIDPRYQFPNGSSTQPDLISRTKTPDVLFQAHSAVMDIRFYTGRQFPPKYRNGVFAALHGSWNRYNGTGYKIVFLPFGDDHRPKGYYEDFINGFLTDPSGPDTFATPVGLLVMQDGSLLFTDDGNNRIYQVQYIGTENDAHQSYSPSFFLIFMACFLNSVLYMKRK